MPSEIANQAAEASYNATVEILDRYYDPKADSKDRGALVQSILDGARKACGERQGETEGIPDGDKPGQDAVDAAAVATAQHRVGHLKAAELVQEFKAKADFWREQGVTLANYLESTTRRDQDQRDSGAAELVIADDVRLALITEFGRNADLWQANGVELEAYIQKHGRAIMLRREFKARRVAGRFPGLSEDQYVGANS